MGVFDKIKNALFEEEYVEVEEKPKVKSKPKKEKKEIEKEEKPIAKRIVLPERKEDINDEIKETPLDEDFDVEPLKNKSDNNFKFPMVDDGEFSSVDEKYIVEDNNNDISYEPEIVKTVESEVKKPYESSYHSNKSTKNLYGIDESSKINVHEYGMYEKEKKVFRPSPIISPIYGVLDKNYKKEEIVTKREVRLTSSYAREKMSVDEVRNKAYGSLSDDIVREIEEEPKHVFEDVSNYEDDSNLLVDLSSNINKPEVKDITMGDAEEYFQDLGLEYNVDYKDMNKEKATGRRTKIEDSVEIEEEKSVSEDKVVSAQKDTNNNDDNLFDLIDSMYEDED